MKLENKYIIIIFSIAFFVIYSYLAITTPPYFVSPDENTNYFFINLYSNNGNLSYFEPLNDVAEGIIHPRGATYFNGRVVPIKFVGAYVLYGTIAIFIKNFVIYLTPLLAIIGNLFFYKLIRDIFNQKIAILSSLLLLSFPPFWYWSTLSMYIDVAAVTFSLASLRYFFKSLERNDGKYYLLAGLFLGIPFSIAPLSVFLVIPIGLIILIEYKKLHSHLLLFVISLLLTLSPFLLTNKELYGGYFTTGYHIGYNISNTISSPGFNPANFIGNLDNQISLMPLFFSIIFLGMIYYSISIYKKKSKLLSYYFIFWITYSVLLISYNFNQPIVNPPSLHISYVRYLLPIYVLSIPFFSMFLYSIKKQAFVITLTILVIVIVNTQLVLPNITSIGESKYNYEIFSKNIVRQTESDSVIFVQYWDKALFPARKVGDISLLTKLQDNNSIIMLSDIMIRLAEIDVPVYLMKDRPLNYSELDEELGKSQYELHIIDKKFQLYKLIKSEVNG